MKKNDKTESSATPPPSPAPPVRVRCKVLANGLHIAEGIAARGAILTVDAATAEFHEGRKELEILGTA